MAHEIWTGSPSGYDDEGRRICYRTIEVGAEGETCVDCPARHKTSKQEANERTSEERSTPPHGERGEVNIYNMHQIRAVLLSIIIIVWSVGSGSELSWQVEG